MTAGDKMLLERREGGDMLHRTTTYGHLMMHGLGREGGKGGGGGGGGGGRE